LSIKFENLAKNHIFNSLKNQVYFKFSLGIKFILNEKKIILEIIKISFDYFFFFEKIHQNLFKTLT